MNPEELRALKESLDELTATNRTLINNVSFWRSFVHGVVTAIGATVGATIVIAVLGSILHFLAGANILKPFVEPVLPYVERKTISTPSSSLPQPTYESPSPQLSPSPSVSTAPATTPTTSSY